MSVLRELAFKKPDEAEKIAAVKRILDGDATVQSIADQYRVSSIQVHGWRKAYGTAAARKATMDKLKDVKEELLNLEEEKTGKRKYKTRTHLTKEQKAECVDLYLSGIDIQDITSTYNIGKSSLMLMVKQSKQKAEPKKEEPKRFVIAPKQTPTESAKEVLMVAEVTPEKERYYERQIQGLKNEIEMLKSLIVDQLLEQKRLQRGITFE